MAIPYEPGEPLACQQVRKLDQLAIEQIGIPGIVLMENAARNAAEVIYASLATPLTTHVVILCGPGNNGGDGFVIARHLHNAGVRTTVVLAAAESRYQGDARTNLIICRRMNIHCVDASVDRHWPEVQSVIEAANLLVDALLGTGSREAPRGVIAKLIRAANERLDVPKFAVDIPSGLDGDAGTVFEPCFRADTTLTFVAAKPGFAAAGAMAQTGRVIALDIGIPRELIPGRAENEAGVDC